MMTRISSLRHLLIVVLMIITLPWLLVSIQSSLDERDRLMREAGERGLALLDNLDAMERLNLGGALRTIESLLPRGEGRGVPESLTPQMLAEGVGHELLPIAITDFRGNVLASSLPLADPEALSLDQQVHNALTTGKLSFGAAKGLFGPEKDGLIVAYPVIRPGDAIEFVIVAFVDEERYLEPLGSVELPHGVAIEVSDMEGNLVARYLEPRADGVEGEARTTGLLLGTRADKGDYSAFQRSSDGSMQLVASKIIRDSRGTPMLHATLSTPASVPLARMNALAFGRLAVLLVVAAIVIPIVWQMFHTEVLSPVERLAALAGRLERGELGVRHGGPYRRGELGFLARAFDQMSKALERRATQLTYVSHHDSLTGAHNRAYIESMKEKLSCEENLPTTVIMGDINGLKRVNDVYGHSVGDEMIIAAGNIMRACVGERGVVARWAGDEFIAILPNTDFREGLRICREIRSACTLAESDSAGLSIALGAATRVAPGRSLRDARIAAEKRMYANKLADATSGRGMLLHSLRQALAERTHETQEHSNRMRFLAIELGQMLGLSASTLDDLALLADLHDIGKIGIPDRILQKPGGLTPAEWDVMRAHPEIGARIVGGCYELEHIARAILAHHERWDGGGYPRGLGGHQIPLISRILSIVDAYDAMTSDRPYRKAMSREDALREIRTCSGMQFDPDLADIFLEMMDEMGRHEEYENTWFEMDTYRHWAYEEMLEDDGESDS